MKTLSVNLKRTFLEFCQMNLAYSYEVFLQYLLFLEMQQLTSAIIRATLSQFTSMLTFHTCLLSIHFQLRL